MKFRSRANNLYQTYIKSTILCAIQGVSLGEEHYQNVPFILL